MIALRTALLIGFIAFAVLLLQKMPLDLAIYRSVIVTLGTLFLMILAAVFMRILRGRQPEDDEEGSGEDQKEDGNPAQKNQQNKQSEEGQDDTTRKEKSSTTTEEAPA